MAIGVRDITNLEELLEVQDNDKIIVIQNGEAKLVSKANATLGGGTVNVFHVDPNDKSDLYKRLVDVNGNLISAQAAYDALISGPVYIALTVPELQQKDAYMTASGFQCLNTDGNITSVVFFSFDNIRYYAGQNPDTIDGGHE